MHLLSLYSWEPLRQPFSFQISSVSKILNPAPSIANEVVGSKPWYYLVASTIGGQISNPTRTNYSISALEFDLSSISLAPVILISLLLFVAAIGLGSIPFVLWQRLYFQNFEEKRVRYEW